MVVLRWVIMYLLLAFHLWTRNSTVKYLLEDFLGSLSLIIKGRLCVMFGRFYFIRAEDGSSWDCFQIRNVFVV